MVAGYCFGLWFLWEIKEGAGLDRFGIGLIFGVEGKSARVSSFPSAPLYPSARSR